MGKPILEITVRLGDGKVVTGKSPNVPGTLEHLYNQALKLSPKRRLKLVEGLGKRPECYLGARRAQFGYRQKAKLLSLDEAVEVEVKAA